MPPMWVRWILWLIFGLFVFTAESRYARGRYWEPLRIVLIVVWLYLGWLSVVVGGRKKP